MRNAQQGGEKAEPFAAQHYQSIKRRVDLIDKRSASGAGSAREGALPTVYARALKRAAEIVGGAEQLAVQLRVVPSHLALWIDGSAPTPPDIFLRAVDLISEHDAPGKRPH